MKIRGYLENFARANRYATNSRYNSSNWPVSGSADVCRDGCARWSIDYRAARENRALFTTYETGSRDRSYWKWPGNSMILRNAYRERKVSVIFILRKIYRLCREFLRNAIFRNRVRSIFVRCALRVKSIAVTVWHSCVRNNQRRKEEYPIDRSFIQVINNAIL